MSEKPTYLRTARLLSANSSTKNAVGYGTALSYEPLTGSNDKGQIFITIEIMTLAEVGRGIAEKIIETAKREYYREEESDISKSFEYMLMAVNDELGEIAESGSIDWIGKISAIIAVAHDNELHIAKTGSAEAYLFRNDATSHISEELNTPHTDNHPLKTFANIVSGELYIGDKLIFTTPGIFYHLSLPELHNIVVEHSPGGSITYLSKMLDKANLNRLSLLVIEGTTSEILSYEISSNEPNEIILNEPKITPVRQVTGKSAPIINAIRATFDKLSADNTISLSVPKFSKKDLLNVNNLKSKPVLVIMSILLLVLSIGIIRHNNKVEKVRVAATTELSRASTLADEAETLSFTDKRGAINKYKEALKIVSVLTDQKYTLGEAKALESDIAAQIQSLKSIYETSETELADLTAILPGTPIKLFRSSNDLYVFDSKGTIVKIKSGSKEVEQLSGKPLNGTLLDVAFNESRLKFYLLSNTGNVYSFGLEERKLVSLRIAGGGAWPKGDAIDVYPVFGSNDYIYILSRKDKTIYYHTAFSGGYTSKRVYYSDKSVKDVRDFTLDSSLFLLFKSGKGMKLAQGQKQKFTIRSLDTLANPRQILADRTVKNLYIFDEDSRVISVFKKNGNYIQANIVKNCCLTSFAVNEKKQVYYLLIGKKLYVKTLVP